ncbi:MAG: PKD domain-containing protein [Chitinophagaceae bacterium]
MRILFFVLFIACGQVVLSQAITPSGPVSFCQGGSVLLTAPTGTAYQWLVGGSPIAGATASTYTATTSGTYAVTVTIAGTPVITEPLVVTVNPKPVVTFTNGTNICSDINVPFTSTVTGGTPAYTYLWTFGDGGNSIAQNPSHPFTSLGCGTVVLSNSLLVTDVNGCTGTFSNPVTILQAPDVQVRDNNTFTPFSNCDNSPTPANPNYSITINNISPNAACISGYSINWGDGNSQTGLSAGSFPLSHTYTQLGAFPLAITGVGTNGCSHTKIYTVANQSNPDIGIGTVGPTEACNSLDVNIVIGFWQNNSPGTTYSLNYGDGHTVVLTHPLNPAFTNDTIIHNYSTSACPNLQGFPLSITATNACRTKTFGGGDIIIKIKPQAKFIPATSPACTGQSVCFTNQTIAGYYNNCSTLTNYTWDFGDPGSGITNNASTLAGPCHVYANPGNYTVTLTAANPCGLSTYTQQVCVTAPPVPSFTVGATDVCAGTTVQATNTSITGTCPGSSYQYQWTVTYATGFCGTTSSWAFANGTTASSVNPSFVFNNSGVYTIHLTIIGSCNNSVVQKIINVKKPPQVNLSAIANACDQVTLCPVATVTNCGTGPLNYLWSFDGGANGTSQAATPGCIAFSGNGTHTVSLSVSNECGTTTLSRDFTIASSPDLVIPSSAIYCPGDNTGAFAFSSSTPGAVITWANNNTGIGLASGGAGNIPSFVAANATAAPITAIITVTSIAGGCPKQLSFTITVNARPALPIVTTPVNYCKDDPPAPLIATGAAGNTILWYTAATGGTASTAVPTPVTNTTGTKIYYVSQQNPATSCESNRAAITVNVSPVPVISNGTSTNPINCASSTGTISLNGLLPSTVYTVRYTKNGTPVTVSLTSNAGGTITITGLTAGVYADINVSQNGCVSNMVGPFILTDPNPPPLPTADNNHISCSGQQLNLTANSTATGVTYSWTGPNGFSSTQQNPVINPATVAASGTYFLTAILNNCTSAPASTDVLINPTPVAPVVTNNRPCEHDQLNFTSTSTFAGPLMYAWSGPNGFSSAAQNPSIANASATLNGVYNLVITATTGNCSSPAGTTTVTILPRPVINSGSFINPIGCGSATGSIILNGLSPSTSYTIQYTHDGGLPVSVTAISNSAGSMIIGSLTGGLYTNISVSFGGCGSNVVGPFSLTDTPPFSIVTGSNSPLCENNTLFLSANVTTTSGGATYSWTGPNGFTSDQQNPSIPAAGIINSGTYTANATVNGCSTTTSFTVTISNSSVGGNTAPNANVCKRRNNGTITLTGYTGQVIRWEASVNSGLGWGVINNTTASLDYHDLTQTTWYRAVIQSGACPLAYSTNTIITVINSVDSVYFNPRFVTTCNHDTTITFRATADYSGADPVSFAWYVNGQVLGSSNPFIHRFTSPLTNSSAEVFTIRVLAENVAGCGDTSEAGKVTIYPLPNPSIEVSPSLQQYQPHYTFTFKDAAPASVSKYYTWTWNDPAAQTNHDRQFSHQFSNVGSYPVNLKVVDMSTGCWAGNAVTVTIFPVAGTLFIPNAFYPNSSINDLREFNLKGVGLKRYRFQIFDTWGKLLFETTELNPDGSPKVAWNGRYLNTGYALPQDVYTWRVTEAIFINEQKWDGMSYNDGPPKSFGTVTLFR